MRMLSGQRADSVDILDQPRFNLDGERLIFNGDVERDGYDGINYVDCRFTNNGPKSGPDFVFVKPFLQVG